MAENKTHHGRNIKRLREILGIKQEALAIELGSDWNQKKISMLEAKEEIEDALLSEVARVLKMPVDALKNYDEEKTFLNIQNNYDGSSNNNYNFQCSFNPIDKVIELYERMLKDKEEMIKRLEGMVK